MKSSAKKQPRSGTAHSKSQLLKKLKEAGFKSPKRKNKPLHQSVNAITQKLQPDREQLSEEELARIPQMLNDFAALNRMVRALAATETSEGNAAILKVLRETCANVRLLHKLPATRVRPVARQMHEFPIMASPVAGGIQETKNQLARLHVAGDFPQYLIRDKSKRDIFAAAAEGIYDELVLRGENLASVDLSNWDDFWKRIQKEILPKHLEANFDVLAEALTAARDRKTKGNMQARITERICFRLRAMVDVTDG